MARALPFVLGLAGLWACRFPDLAYDTAENDAAALWDAAGDGTSSSSSGGDVFDGASRLDSASDAQLDGGAVDADPCDKDNDGFLNAACMDSDATPGVVDCCDTDGLAHPKQTMFFTHADNCGSYDYDCNGVEEHEYGANLHCGYLLGVGCIPTCTGVACTTGFVGPDPGCGASAAYDQCEPNSIGVCGTAPVTPSQPDQTQACR